MVCRRIRGRLRTVQGLLVSTLEKRMLTPTSAACAVTIAGVVVMSVASSWHAEGKVGVGRSNSRLRVVVMLRRFQSVCDSICCSVLYIKLQHLLLKLVVHLLCTHARADLVSVRDSQLLMLVLKAVHVRLDSWTVSVGAISRRD